MVYVEVYKLGELFSLVIADKHGGTRVSGPKVEINSKCIATFLVSETKLNKAIQNNKFKEV